MIHVIHDYLMVRGGAERLALTLASGLSAPLITGFRTRDVTDWGDNAEIHPLGSVIDGRLMKYLATAARFNNIAPALLSQEANIYSGVLAPFAAKRQTMGRRIHYCHSPPRFLYDLKNFYCDQMSFVRRRGMSLFDAWYKPGYEAALRAMDLVIANSQNVARRVRNLTRLGSASQLWAIRNPLTAKNM